MLTLPEVVTIDGRKIENFLVAKSDTMWALLPANVRVQDETGAPIEPSKGRSFYVTAETFNPWHGLTEASSHDF